MAQRGIETLRAGYEAFNLTLLFIGLSNDIGRLPGGGFEQR